MKTLRRALLYSSLFDLFLILILFEALRIVQSTNSISKSTFLISGFVVLATFIFAELVYFISCTRNLRFCPLILLEKIFGKECQIDTVFPGKIRIRTGDGKRAYLLIKNDRHRFRFELKIPVASSSDFGLLIMPTHIHPASATFPVSKEAIKVDCADLKGLNIYTSEPERLGKIACEKLKTSLSSLYEEILQRNEYFIVDERRVSLFFNSLHQLSTERINLLFEIAKTISEEIGKSTKGIRIRLVHVIEAFLSLVTFYLLFEIIRMLSR